MATGDDLILGAQGAVLAAAGAALFLAPVAAGSLWPSALTPLTAQMIGSWLIAFGVAGFALSARAPQFPVSNNSRTPVGNKS